MSKVEQAVEQKWIALNNEVKQRDEKGQFKFHKDKEAVRSYFVDFVNKNMQFYHNLQEKLDYMIENEYWDEDVVYQYTYEQIEEIHDYLYSKKFRFQSYMSAFKFYNNYALKSDDGKTFLERYEDRLLINALALAEGRFGKAKELARQLIRQTFQPATPTFLNAGRKRGGRMVSCFLLGIPDSTEGIMYISEAIAQLSRFGGGVAVNGSYLRAEGEDILGMEGIATSVLGIAKIYEDIVHKFNQLGQRQGSAVFYLNAFHADIKGLLNAKKINADETDRLKTLSIGVIVPNKLFELAKADKEWYSFYPHNVKKVTGTELHDMKLDEWYDKLLDNPKIRKKPMGSARSFLEEVGRTQLESGYPYIIMQDNINRVHLLKDIGDVKMSNLCVEIAQVQSPSDVQGYAGTNTFGEDVSCNLGSLNVYNVMRHKDIMSPVKIAVDALTSVTDNTSIDEVPSIKNGNDSYHAIGLGAMNLHGYLATEGIQYESREAKDFANTFFMMMRFYALQRSNEIAIERNKAFKDFDKSEYAKGTALNMYLEHDFSPRTEKVKAIFKDIHVPTKEDWAILNASIVKHGIYNAYLLAIAPTGSISYVSNATSSILPIVERIESRLYGDSLTQYPMPFLDGRTWWYYKEAYQVDMFKLIDLVAIVQQHVDQSISTTLFVESEGITDADLARYYIYAWEKGLKSLYYTRTKVSNVSECVSCAV